MTRRPQVWEDRFGFAPHTVWVGERADKGGTLYLRWRPVGRGNWRWRSLGLKVRDDRGRLVSHVVQMARTAAREKYEELTGRPTVPTETVALTIRGTWPLLIDRTTGLYPHPSPHRREVENALGFAARVWGPETPWALIDRARLRQLGRVRYEEARKHGQDGARLAEIAVSRVLTVARWLRDEGRIPIEAALPSAHWRTELQGYIAEARGGHAPAPRRPRHALEDMRAILAAAWAVDPRLGLLLALGAELRLGQVVRCRRSHLDLERSELTIPGRGNKRGTVVLLTDGQRRAVERELAHGYLRDLEGAGGDFLLFAAGQLRGGRSGEPLAVPERHGAPDARPIQSRTWNAWFREAEALAGVEHVPGRAAYGLRRVAVDAVKAQGISREGLKEHGGWTSTQIPDRVYADEQALAARREARDARAKLRGEEEWSGDGVRVIPERCTAGLGPAGSGVGTDHAAAPVPRPDLSRNG